MQPLNMPKNDSQFVQNNDNFGSNFGHNQQNCNNDFLLSNLSLQYNSLRPIPCDPVLCTCLSLKYPTYQESRSSTVIFSPKKFGFPVKNAFFSREFLHQNSNQNIDPNEAQNQSTNNNHRTIYESQPDQWIDSLRLTSDMVYFPIEKKIEKKIENNNNKNNNNKNVSKDNNAFTHTHLGIVHNLLNDMSSMELKFGIPQIYNQMTMNNNNNYNNNNFQDDLNNFEKINPNLGQNNNFQNNQMQENNSQKLNFILINYLSFSMINALQWLLQRQFK
jgi:hypothetical protein